MNKRLAQRTAELSQSNRLLQQQMERERLVTKIAQHIRQSLKMEEVLNTTVAGVREFLQVERVYIYRFQPDYSGVVVVESVDEGCISILNAEVQDTYFMQTQGEEYRQGRIQAVADIYTADLTECHCDLLVQFQIRANLAVPILQGEKLWGLLVANQCSTPRQWQQLEIDLLKQLATQVSIAIQQAELHEQLEAELIERGRAQEQIREQAALLDVATDAICVRNLQQQILFWNQGAERLYGFSAAEALGKNVNELFCPEMSSQVAEAMKTVVESGSWQGELQKVTKSGKKVIVECRWSLVRDADGQPKSILTVDTDITEKKHLEQQFLHSQRLESLGTLASGIAHDLNNILTPILTSAQLLTLKLTNIDQQNRRLVQILEDNSKRAADLVKQILIFARGDEGQRIPLQIEHLLLEIEQIANSTFPKSIEISTHISTQTLGMILADPTQMHQVLINLCVNARDAMLNGGKLHISAQNFFIDQNFARMNLDAQVGTYIAISVSDTGFGIPPEIFERIFEPFFTTKEPGNGTGLGLSTVIGIVKSHGGFVKVYSEVGKGSQFQVYLPTVEAKEKGRPGDGEFVNGNGELILVVDDEPLIREITKTSLEVHNYRVLTVSDGIEAIVMYSQYQDEISVVLMDMMMPSMDGLTAIRTLRRINHRVKIIATSGLATKSQFAKAAGANAFLTKPYTAKELLQAVVREQTEDCLI